MFATDGSEAAFTWHRGRFQILPTLGGPTAGSTCSTIAASPQESPIWTPTGHPRQPCGAPPAPHGLGFFPGGNLSWILGTNGQGDYTGIASLSPTDPFNHVFVAHTGGPLLALSPLSGDYATNPSIAHGIDRHDDVAGASTTSDGDAHATLWPHAFDQAFRPSPVAQTSRRTRGHSPHGERAGGRESRRSWWLSPGTHPVVPRPS